MESQVSPKNIEARVEAMAAAAAEKPITEEKPIETKVEPKVETKVEPKVEAKVEPKVETKVEPIEAKTETKVEPKGEKKQPNDPSELRKWSTKLSQENAALRDEMKAIKAAIEKMSKKPVDYASLAKDPEALRKHVESERAEAAAELQTKLEEANTRAVKNETVIERIKREQDTENYPRWGKLFPLIQSLAANTDGRINFQQAPGDVLDSLYALAAQLSPVDEPVAKEEPKVEPKVEAPAATKTPEQIEAEIQTRIADARKQAFDEAQASLRAEAAGAGVASQGKGGRRDNKLSKEAYEKMDRQELKKLIQSQS